MNDGGAQQDERHGTQRQHHSIPVSYTHLDKAYDYDSAVVQHDGGKATVSEIRFAGKKYALALGATEKAAMSAGAGK